MNLDDLFMPPISIDGSRVRREAPLGPWPEPVRDKLAVQAAWRERHREEIREKQRARRASEGR